MKKRKKSKKFQYAIEPVLNQLLTEEFLDDFGNKGWELVNIESFDVNFLSGGTNHYKRCYFKRELTTENV